MSSLQDLKSATSLKDVARILEVEPHILSFILYKIPPAQKYQTFEVPKKSGGSRTINAPTARLKSLQRSVADLLYRCTSEIDSETKLKRLSHAFRHSHSIVTNAYPHKNRRYVLNLDLKDFFPTFNFGRVRGFLQKNNAFLLHERVATILAQIACFGNELPQGSPCSPIISDIVGHILDVRLVKLAKTHKCTYTRYADDITFSTNQKIFPPSIASRSSDTPSEWQLGQELIRAITSADFAINYSKTRMQCRPSRQLVTGLTVNQKVNIRSDYYKAARAMCNHLFDTGTYFLPGKDPIADRTPSLKKLEGILSHIHFVKNGSDPRTTAEKSSAPTAARTLHKDFLFYKYFAQPSRPLVVCEGKTDSVYLKAAIQNLKSFHPKLAQISGQTCSHKLSFFNYSNLAHEILDIGGGTGGQVALIRDYENTLSKFKRAPLLHPVIVLIDNDSGSTPVFGIVRNKFKINPTINTTSPFYHLCHNLYLIKTPEKPPTGETMIESLFEPAVLNSNLDGKTFNLTNNNSASNEVGKTAFADFVRTNASKIKFDGFVDLLSRIVAVLDHYKPPQNL